MRSVAVRHSIRQTVGFKDMVSSSFSDASTDSQGYNIDAGIAGCSALRAEALDFIPQIPVALDEKFLNLHTSAPSRRILRDTVVLGEIGVCPPTPEANACKLEICSSLDLAATVVGRKIIREAGIPDSLPEVPVPPVYQCSIIRSPTERRCRGLGHAPCDKCYVPDGRYGRHRKCERRCAVIDDGTWGPTVCCSKCTRLDSG